MDIFSIFFNIKVFCVFSLESPHRGASINEYTQYTVFNIKKKIILNYPKCAVMGFFFKGLKNQFETVMVNEYCTLILFTLLIKMTLAYSVQ